MAKTKRAKLFEHTSNRELRKQALKHLASVYTFAHEIPDHQAIKDYEEGELDDLAITCGDIEWDAKNAKLMIEELAYREEGK